MSILKVQRKGQVTIPTRLRTQVGLADGDLVEARAYKGKIDLLGTSRGCVTSDLGATYAAATQRHDLGWPDLQAQRRLNEGKPASARS